MLNTELMFSSKTDDWATPQSLFEALDAVFHFTLDVCASAENAKCRAYFTEADDALSREWCDWRNHGADVCWMNPPYGRGIYAWVKKAHESAQQGSTVVCLLPARTDTRWWQDFCLGANEVHFIRGRLKFGGATNAAPFPSAVVVFRPGLGNVSWKEI